MIVHMNKTHGLSRTRFYGIFVHARRRCNRVSQKDYPRYGGLGVRFLWKDFESFRTDMYPTYLKHIKENGEADTTIDRIKSSGDYCKENCRWVTFKQQARNRKSNVFIKLGNRKMMIAEWADVLGINTYTLRTRLRRGMPLKRALSSQKYRE